MSYRFVNVEREGPITLVTINRPEVMNALHPPAQQEMEKVFDDFQNDPEQWIAIVTGAGDKAFSAGNDLKFQAEHGSAAVRDGLQGVKGGFGGLHRRTDLYKPVIAAVNGFALGGGFEIVLSCDIIIAAEHATFGLPEPRVGLMAGAGGVHRLPRQIPYHIAMGMMLTGRRVTRARRRALRSGQRGGAGGQPAGDRAQVGGGDPGVRAALDPRQQGGRGRGAGHDAAGGARPPLRGVAKMAGSADFVEGPRAFAEKRKPNWTGA